MAQSQEVFAFVAEPAAAAEKPKPGAKSAAARVGGATTAATAAPAPPPPAPKWHVATLDPASGKVKLSDDTAAHHSGAVQPLETIPRADIADSLRFCDLAALPKHVQVLRAVDCIMHCAAIRENLLGVSNFAGSVVRADAGSGDVDSAVSAAINNATHRGIVCPTFITFGGLANYGSTSVPQRLVEKVFGDQGGDALDNARRILSWYFGDENATQKTSWIISGMVGESGGVRVACIPHFALNKSTVLPHGDMPSTAVEDASVPLNINLTMRQQAVSWLCGLAKLWRLTAGTAGFKGTESDLVDAAALLFPHGEGGAKLLADFLAPDKSSSKAAAAQLDEKRVAISQCIVQQICSVLFFPIDRVLVGNISDGGNLTENDCASKTTLVVALAEVPGHAAELVSTTPLEMGVLEALSASYNRGGTNWRRLAEIMLSGGRGAKISDAATGKDVASMADSEIVLRFIRKAHECGAALPSSYADASKEILVAITSDAKMIKSDGKEGLVLANNLGKYSSTSTFIARVFAQHVLFPSSSSSPSSCYSACAEFLAALHKRINQARATPIVLVQCSASATPAQRESSVHFVSTMVQSLRVIPVENIGEQQLRAIRFAVSDLLPKPKKASGAKPTAVAGRAASAPAASAPLILADIAGCILKRLAEIAGAAASGDLGVFLVDEADASAGMLALTVLGKLAMDTLRSKFALSKLSHVSRRLQYLVSSRLVLRRCCRRTVQVVASTGFLARLSAEITADLLARQRIREHWRWQHEQRRIAEDRETAARSQIEHEKSADLHKIMSLSGGFLMPLIKRRKDRCFRDEIDLRVKIYSVESKARRALCDRFFDEEPDEAVPAPVEGLRKIRERFAAVKPAMDAEEEARMGIVAKAREELLGIVAVAELQREKIKVKFIEKKVVTVPWRELELAAKRRQMDEERAVDFLYSRQDDRGNSRGNSGLSGVAGVAARPVTTTVASSLLPLPQAHPPLRVSFGAYWHNYK